MNSASNIDEISATCFFQLHFASSGFVGCAHRDHTRKGTGTRSRSTFGQGARRQLLRHEAEADREAKRRISSREAKFAFPPLTWASKLGLHEAELQKLQDEETSRFEEPQGQAIYGLWNEGKTREDKGRQD